MKKVTLKQFFKILKIKWIDEQCLHACLFCPYADECLENFIEEENYKNETTLNIRPCYTVEEIKKRIKLYDDVYQNNYFDIIRNGRIVIRARNYEETIAELHAITTDKNAIIIQNPSCLSDIYVFVSI
jgi:hypothetical protein